MKVSWNWINCFASVADALKRTSAVEFAHKYSVHTAEVDATAEVGNLPSIVIGKVLETRAHPNSDKLNLVQVDCGAHGKLGIVCGAENVVGAKYVAVALVGTQISEDMCIAKREIRGEESNGMICSLDELGLCKNRAAGILRLEDLWEKEFLESKLGEAFFELSLSYPCSDGSSGSYVLRDVIFDLDNKFITNRPDLFEIIGNAREFATLLDTQMHDSKIMHYPASAPIECKIETDKALAYTLTRYENTNPIARPLVFEILLHRSAHALIQLPVDITNLVCHEIQPMHVFDADKVRWTIVVRAAQTGEKLQALDNHEYILETSDIVIADDSGPIALAGIIGGSSTATDLSTHNILVEAGTWDPVSTRKTSQRLGIRTDASMRFEKSFDTASTHLAQERFRQLLSFAASKEQTPTNAFVFQTPQETIMIDLPLARLVSKMGAPIQPSNVEKILTQLGCKYTQQTAGWTVQIPSWRATKDIRICEDLIEEVARIWGYDHIIPCVLSGSLAPSHMEPALDLNERLTQFLTSRGWYEAYSYTFGSEEHNQLYGLEAKNAFEVAQPYSQDHKFMRANILDSLLLTLQENYRKHSGFGVFEHGHRFARGQQEILQRCGVSFGKPKEEVLSVISDLLGLLHPGIKLRRKPGVIQSQNHIFHPNKSSTFWAENNVQDTRQVATVGYIHPRLAAAYGLPSEEIILWELTDLTWLDNLAIVSQELNRYPGVTRELNVLLETKRPVYEAIETLEKTHAFIRNIQIKEIYTDETKLGVGKKSVLLGFELINPEATLTDEEALKIQEHIIQEMTSQGMPLRAI